MSSTVKNHVRRGSVTFAIAILAAACGGPSLPAKTPKSVKGSDGQAWTLTWADEFDAQAGTPPDPERWTHDVGGHGWGNWELEYYTDRVENAAHDGQGNLVITARREDYQGKEYTSARLRSDGKFDQEYGRFEARMKLPEGAGIWPAFWLLGADTRDVGWPQCGEIDIMENKGSEPEVIHGSAHLPGASGGDPLSGKFKLPKGKKFSDDFHTFAVEWEEGEIRWLVDDAVYSKHVTKEVGEEAWVFDHPFFVIFNLAIGGGFGGEVGEDTKFPAQLLVDHIRVYSRD